MVVGHFNCPDIFYHAPNNPSKTRIIVLKKYMKKACIKYIQYLIHAFLVRL